MKRILATIVVCLTAVAFTFAQEATPLPAKVLPMFGKIAKTEAQQKSDEKFLKSSDASFSTRPEASKFFMERGWQYLNEGQIDTAMHRFNLAWLLNPDNSETYWAFGLVTVARGNPAEAVEYYQKALSYEPKNALLLSDLANCYLAIYNQNPKKKTLKQATAYTQQALAADAQNAFACFAMSQVEYHNKKYAEAWTWLHKGRELNITAMDYTYLMQLIEKMPDPKGFFNQKEQAEEQSE
ncbi:tetratricopeptide repeat protein [Pontibacter burrus]|uniref:Tetratricopeptide repeat protein n=1 Tax=Pontibacter burrus TaxID=2704466 RepID=A0A6B3LYW8_9BACT|nr:tetratricopeptide repeat protein [Pontibacter burrus]NEM98958.1 tetratricopeptide repeat protein [Pontibacter burrus]